MVRIVSCKKDVGCNGGFGEKRWDYVCIRLGKLVVSVDLRLGFMVLGVGSCYYCGLDLVGFKFFKFGVVFVLIFGFFGEWGVLFDDDMF